MSEAVAKDIQVPSGKTGTTKAYHDLRSFLVTLEAEGQVFSGRYRVPSGDELEWCNRRILARIHQWWGLPGVAVFGGLLVCLTAALLLLALLALQVALGALTVGGWMNHSRLLSDGNITRNFNPGEEVLVELYSDTLRNLANTNSFFVYQPLTGAVMTPPSSDAAFGYGGIYGDFYRYNYTFTAPTIGYTYPIQFNLKDNIGTVVNIWDQIIISGSQYPKVQTYLYDGTQLVPCTNFSLTDTIYVKVTTLDVDGQMTSVFMNDLTVSDYSGRYIVRKTPTMPVLNPTTGGKTPVYTAPVSAVFKTDSSNGINWVADGKTSANDPSARYTFYFKPIDANAGWWLARRN